jgi:hypothetical protein
MSKRSWKGVCRAAGDVVSRGSHSTRHTIIEALEPRAYLNTASVPPLPPSDLVGVSRPATFVRLAFTDNSIDETEFIVEYTFDGASGYHVAAHVPASPGTGSRVFAYPQPETGRLTYRVRAISGAGQSDPSNTVTLSQFIGPPGVMSIAYFAGSNFEGPAIVPDYPYYGVTYRESIEFSAGTGSPDPRVGADNFSVVSEGMLHPELSERYTFYTASAGGIAVRLVDPRDNRVLVDFDNLAIERDIPDFGYQDVAGEADLEAGQPYFFQVRFSDRSGNAAFRIGWSSRSTPVEAVPSSVVDPLLPGGAKVAGVQVSGTDWSHDFLNALNPPNGSSGYVFPRNTGQLLPVPWVGLNRIRIIFNRDVHVDRDALTVRGVTVPQYGFADFTPPSAANFWSAYWTLDRPIGADRIELALKAAPATGGVVGATDGGLPLDGEWADGATPRYSGDGRPGGDFHFRFNVLPGDVNRDGRVLADDFSEVKKRFFRTATSPVPAGDTQYSVFADVNGSGDILADDYGEVKKRFFTTLPDAPAPAAAAAATVALRTSPVRRELFGATPVL